MMAFRFTMRRQVFDEFVGVTNDKDDNSEQKNGCVPESNLRICSSN